MRHRDRTGPLGEHPGLDPGRAEALDEQLTGHGVDLRHGILLEVAEERLSDQLIAAAGQDPAGGDVDLEDQQLRIAHDVAQVRAEAPENVFTRG